MKNFARVTFACLFLLAVGIGQAYTQCTQGTLYGSGVASATCTTVTATAGTTCHFINEYAKFTGLTLGNTYEIGTNVPGTSTATSATAGAHMLTLYDGTGAVLTFQANAVNNLTSITFTATTTEVRVQTNTYTGSVCGTSGPYCMYYGLRCTSCPGPGAPACPTLSSPANNATGVSTLPTLSWILATNAVSYDIYLDADATCTSTPSTLIANVTTLSYTLTSGLSGTTKYRWRVVPKDCAGNAPASCIANAFCFTTTVAPPANDNCTGANGTPVALTPQPNAASCTSPVSATTAGATQTSATCGSTSTNDDVWFTFTANATSEIVRFEGVVAVTGSVTAMGMDLYTTCGGSNTNCNTSLTLASGNAQGALTGLTISTTYLLRIWTTGASNNATFNICVIDPPPPPVNDDCSGATVLSVGSGFPCTPSNPFSWINATASSVTAPTCGSYTTGDIWYTFTLGADASVIINTAPGTGATPIIDGAMSLYSGACGSLTEVECDDDDGALNMPQIRRFLTAGTYYVRFWDFSDKITADFGGICVNTITPLANDNCSGVNGTPVILTPQPFAAACSSPVSATTVGATQSNTDCSPAGTFAADDVWFQFTTGAGVTSQIIRFQNVATVFGGSVTTMALNTYTVCGGASANCTTSITITAGAGQATLTGLTASTTYYLRVWTNSDTDNGATFDICVIDPQPMTYVSSAITQQTGAASAGSTYNKILQLNVVTVNSVNPLSVTQLNFSTTGTPGTSLPADITNARVYYTAATSTWTDGSPAGTQFGSVIVNPSGTMTFMGAQTLSSGANYFWLVYDLACGAVGPNLDASMLTNGLSLNSGGPYTPATPDPGTTRTVTPLAAFTTAANGNWGDPSSWTCSVPPNGTTVPITINHNITLDIDATINASVTIAASKTLTINTNTLNIGTAGTGTQNLTINGTVSVGGGTLNVGTATGVATSNISTASGSSLIASSGTINLGPTDGYNRTWSASGTTTFSGATINVNGSVSMAGAFNMSSGTFNIDPNSGASGTSALVTSLAFNSSSINVTGGNINLLDPPYPTGTSVRSLNYASSTAASLGGTLTLGGGTHTNVSRLEGFHLECFGSTALLNINNLIVAAGDYAARRHASTHTSSPIFGTLVTNMTINSGSELVVGTGTGSPLVVTGNLTNNGVLTVQNTTVDKGLLFCGSYPGGTAGNSSIAQSLSGSGNFRKSTADAPNGLITALSVYHTAASPGLTLSMPVAVNTQLKLSSGRVNTDDTNLLTCGESATVVGTLVTTSVTGWVNGPFRRWVPAATFSVADQRSFYPVGNSTVRRLANLFYTGVPTAGTLIMKYVDGTPGTSGLPMTFGGITINTVSPTGYWSVPTSTVSVSGGTYSMTVDASNFKKTDGTTTITLLTEIRMIKGPDSGNWNASEGTSTTPSSLSAVTGTGFSTFSKFAIGGTNAALPLELASFTGQAQATMNLLAWETLTEKDVQWHIVERSVDGAHWTEVGRKAGQANSSTPLKYSLEDRAPLAKAYYRIRSVDFDGQESKSNAILLTRKGEHFGITSVFPSPTVDDVTVQFVSMQEETVIIRVLDLTGRLVLSQTLEAVQDVNELPLALNGLQAGVYTVTVANGAGISSPVRFVKQ